MENRPEGLRAHRAEEKEEARTSDRHVRARPSSKHRGIESSGQQGYPSLEPDSLATSGWPVSAVPALSPKAGEALKDSMASISLPQVGPPASTGREKAAPSSSLGLGGCSISPSPWENEITATFSRALQTDIPFLT